MEESSQKALLQNLKDAGCGRELIRKFMEIPQSGEEEQINLLTAHREKLLQKIHKEERQITCPGLSDLSDRTQEGLNTENREECEYDNN